jgi:prepilin-type N-terminal cleavage/methylation domain-containing protein
MTPQHTRLGVSLVELLVALVLLAVVAALGAVTTNRMLGVHAQLSVNELRGGAISDALRSVSRRLENTLPVDGDLRAVTDTSIEFLHTVGVTVVCASQRDTLRLLAGADTTPWASSLERALSTDDELRIWNAEAARWTARTIRSVRASGSPCGDSITPWPGNAVQVLTLDDTVPPVRPGALVRAAQRERWSLVRGGDGNWSLSQATWDASRGRYNVPQPLVTPLAAPGAPGGAGLSVRVVSAAGARLSTAELPRARAVLITLRSTVHPRFGQHVDSVRINVGPH